ncbi:MAG: hypothetical protein KBS35_01145 [Mycoplasma sp.]|nr:hypothetical protein [Candidatus Hennigella equi]
MKNPYFRFVEIDKKIISQFLLDHPDLKSFVDIDQPFYVRISKKLYPGLIHTIISDNETNQNVQIQWNQLLTFVRKIKAERIVDLTPEVLIQIVGEKKANLIRNISVDVINDKLNLKEIAKMSEDKIALALKNYKHLSINAINTFILFGCFKQNVLCDSDPDFIRGLQIFLNKQNITQEDINNIKIEYRDQLTLFSLCMWKINNERPK